MSGKKEVMESNGDVKEDANKSDIVELARAYGFFGPYDGDVPSEGKSVEQIDFYTAVDSFLSSVEHIRIEPVDISDEAMLQRLRSTAKYVKDYQEAMNKTDSDNCDAEEEEEEEEEKEKEEEEDEPGEACGGVARIPVPTVSAEAEKLIRSAPALHRKTAELRSFLKELLSEEGREEKVCPPSCPELEESPVRQMLSPSRKIAKIREELKAKEEYPDSPLPGDIQETLDKCIQMLSGDKENAE